MTIDSSTIEVGAGVSSTTEGQLTPGVESISAGSDKVWRTQGRDTFTPGTTPLKEGVTDPYDKVVDEKLGRTRAEVEGMTPAPNETQPRISQDGADARADAANSALESVRASAGPTRTLETETASKKPGIISRTISRIKRSSPPNPQLPSPQHS